MWVAVRDSGLNICAERIGESTNLSQVEKEEQLAGGGVFESLISTWLVKVLTAIPFLQSNLFFKRHIRMIWLREPLRLKQVTD